MLELPYGHTSVPFDETGMIVLRSRIDELTSSRAGMEIVEEAMAHPIGSKPLRELAKGKACANQCGAKDGARYHGIQEGVLERDPLQES